jgi:hypothetical protein
VRPRELAPLHLERVDAAVDPDLQVVNAAGLGIRYADPVQLAASNSSINQVRRGAILPAVTGGCSTFSLRGISPCHGAPKLPGRV